MNTLRILILISIALSSLSFAQENNNPIFGKIVNRQTGSMLYSVCASELKTGEACKGYHVFYFDGKDTKSVAMGAVFVKVSDDFAKQFRAAKREYGSMNYPENPIQAANTLWGKDAEFNMASNAVEDWKAPGILRIPATAAAHIFDLLTVAVSPIGLAIDTALWIPLDISLGIESKRAEKAVRVLLEDGGDIRLARFNFKFVHYLLGGQVKTNELSHPPGTFHHR